MSIFFLKYLLYPAIICLLGFWTKASNNETILILLSKIKLAPFKKLHPKYYANYIGNLMIFSVIPYECGMVFGITTLHFYLGICVMFVLTILIHVAQVTGKPVSAVFEKIDFFGGNNSDNIFLNFTRISILTFFVTGVIVTYLIAPTLKDKITENQNIEQVEETEETEENSN